MPVDRDADARHLADRRADRGDRDAVGGAARARRGRRLGAARPGRRGARGGRRSTTCWSARSSPTPTRSGSTSGAASGLRGCTCNGSAAVRRSIRGEAMTAGESITVECPECGDHFQDWWRPCANLELDPELADPGYLDCAGAGDVPALRQVDPARRADRRRRRVAPPLVLTGAMPQADLAILGASIRTLDPGAPARERASRCATGSSSRSATTRRCASTPARRTELLDGDGITLVPGLVDSHIHPFRGTDGTRGADLGGLRTLDEVRGALAAERARCAPGEWVLGWGLSYDAFHGERIGAEAIADATGDAPAFLTFFDCHSGLASRPALGAGGRRRPARVLRGRRRRLRRRRRADRRAARAAGDGARARARAGAHARAAARRIRGDAAPLQRARADRRARDARRPGAVRRRRRARGSAATCGCAACCRCCSSRTRATRRSRRCSRCATAAAGAGVPARRSSSSTA